MNHVQLEHTSQPLVMVPLVIALLASGEPTQQKWAQVVPVLVFHVLQEPIPLQWACHRACNVQVESIPIQQDRPRARIANHA